MNGFGKIFYRRRKLNIKRKSGNIADFLRRAIAHVVPQQICALHAAGVPIQWNAQQRTASGTTWLEAARAHGWATLIAGSSIAAMYWFQPAVFVWFLPIGLPLLFSIPLSVYSSRVTLGLTSRRWGLFCVPEEKFPPPVLERL